MNLYESIQPHKGFEVLQQICKMKNVKDHFVVTSNVDGHFQKSGFRDDKILEIHGRINKLQCDNCKSIFESKKWKYLVDIDKFQMQELPECEKCIGVILRPNILMFNDYSYISSMSDGQQERYLDFQSRIEEKDKVVILEIGAGLQIPSIRMESESFLYRNPSNTLIRINLYECQPASHMNLLELPITSLQALLQIQQYL